MSADEIDYKAKYRRLTRLLAELALGNVAHFLAAAEPIMEHDIERQRAAKLKYTVDFLEKSAKGPNGNKRIVRHRTFGDRVVGIEVDVWAFTLLADIADELTWNMPHPAPSKKSRQP
jgi:hypothetical protein